MKNGFTFSMVPESLEQMEQTINQLLKRLPVVTRKGLIEGSLIVLKQAQKNSPVLTGNLKASADIIHSAAQKPPPPWVAPDGKPGGIAQLNESWAEFQQEGTAEVVRNLDQVVVCVGFGAFYAVFVHELHSTKGKFLERALASEKDKVLARIVARAKEVTG